MRYDLVVKDYDGPINHSVPSECLPGVQHVCTTAGIPREKLPDLEAFYWGYESEWEQWYEELGAKLSSEEIIRIYHERADNSRSPLAPDVRGFLDLLTISKIEIALVSHHNLSSIRTRLEKERLIHYFGYMWGGYTNKAEKILEACRAHNTTPERTLLIGDTNVELHAAHEVGCDGAIFIPAHDRSYLLKRRPTYYARSYWELAKLLGLI